MYYTERITLGEQFMTLEEYRRMVGWSISELARQADIDFNTAKKALKGLPISTNTAQKIAQALNRVLPQPILVGQIEGLNVIYV
jgi:transcriptional regulator with XRE-family HTH domain